jgi:hypothetical protein
MALRAVLAVIEANEIEVFSTKNNLNASIVDGKDEQKQKAKPRPKRDGLQFLFVH